LLFAVGVADGKYEGTTVLAIVCTTCTCELASVAVTTYAVSDATTVYAGQVDKV
jgi:hypothetical protein